MSLNRIGNCTCTIFRQQKESNCLNLIFVRFRKPRFVPKAPSKIFKVREPTPIDPVEYQKMMEWTRVYNTEKKSLRRFLINHDEELKEREKQRIIEETLTYDELYSQMAVKNAQWNLKSAQVREADMAAKAEVDEVRKQKIAERDSRELEEIREKARKKVLAAEEWKGNYVTKENIDDIVEETLNTRVNYEYAMNVDGTTTKELVHSKEKEPSEPA